MDLNELLEKMLSTARDYDTAYPDTDNANAAHLEAKAAFLASLRAAEARAARVEQENEQLRAACKLAETWFSGSVLSPMEQTIVDALRAALGGDN